MNAWAGPAQVDVYCSFRQNSSEGEYRLSLEGPQIRVSGMTFLVRYDPSCLEFSELKQTPLTQGAMVAKEHKDGILKFGFVSPSAIQDKGIVLTVLFKVNGSDPVDEKALKLEKATASDDLGKMISVRIKQ